MTDKLPEAIASITFTVKVDGFPALYTVRDSESGAKLIEKLPKILEAMKGVNMVPDERFKKFDKKEPEYVEGRVCPTCKEKLVYAMKKDGTKYIKCSTNKWDRVTKTATGCPFVDWDAFSGTSKKVTSQEEDIPDPVEEW